MEKRKLPCEQFAPFPHIKGHSDTYSSIKVPLPTPYHYFEVCYWLDTTPHMLCLRFLPSLQVFGWVLFFFLFFLFRSFPFFFLSSLNNDTCNGQFFLYRLVIRTQVSWDLLEVFINNAVWTCMWRISITKIILKHLICAHKLPEVQCWLIVR